MKKAIFLLLFGAAIPFAKAQTIVTLVLPDPCASYQTSIDDELAFEEASFDFEIFPNPASNEITIRVSAAEKIGKLQIRITNIQGMVYSLEEVYSDNTAWLKTSRLQGILPGVYVVTLSRKNEKLSKRLLIK